MNVSLFTEWPFVSYTYLKIAVWDGGLLFRLDHRGYAPLGTDADVEFRIGTEVWD